MPKTGALTAQQKEAICEALRQCLPMAVACDLIGVNRRTVYDHLNPNSKRYDQAFFSQTRIAKATAIRGLVKLTAEQNGAWRLLKNIGKGYFKERVEVNSINTTINLDSELTKEQKAKSLKYALQELENDDQDQS